MSLTPAGSSQKRAGPLARAAGRPASAPARWADNVGRLSKARSREPEASDRELDAAALSTKKRAPLTKVLPASGDEPTVTVPVRTSHPRKAFRPPPLSCNQRQNAERTSQKTGFPPGHGGHRGRHDNGFGRRRWPGEPAAAGRIEPEDAVGLRQ